MTEQLEGSKATVAAFECDAIVMGLVAAQYGKNYSGCPVRGFGNEIDSRNMYDPVSKLWYGVGDQRRNGRNGCQIVVRHDTVSPPIKTYWIPYDTLSRIYVEFPEAYISE